MVCVCVYHILSYGNVLLGGGGGVVAGLLVRWLGFYEGVENGARKYSLGVIKVVVFCKFGVDVEFFYGIKV